MNNIFSGLNMKLEIAVKIITELEYRAVGIIQIRIQKKKMKNQN